MWCVIYHWGFQSSHEHIELKIPSLQKSLQFWWHCCHTQTGKFILDEKDFTLIYDKNPRQLRQNPLHVENDFRNKSTVNNTFSYMTYLLYLNPSISIIYSLLTWCTCITYVYESRCTYQYNGYMYASCFDHNWFQSSMVSCSIMIIQWVQMCQLYARIYCNIGPYKNA